ncbi:hypothetical protein V6N12_008191 [Hibiscus sabdariffa]|uniref:DUF4283 domain-containing protein n=1 Tax=Hibiscus sabdariffa TaxID=183260 RepID=A0ABR2B313_9ROSI
MTAATKSEYAAPMLCTCFLSITGGRSSDDGSGLLSPLNTLTRIVEEVSGSDAEQPESSPGKPAKGTSLPTKVSGGPIVPKNYLRSDNCFTIKGVVPASDWIKSSLVGQIKGMYDIDFVQQVLWSDGFKASLLNDWFDDIDFIECFMLNKKLKVWISMEGIPLEFWNHSTLSVIAGLRGSVIKVDGDTLQMKRVDAARILLGVSQLADVPFDASVRANDKVFRIKISTAEFEDDRCWINECSLPNQFIDHTDHQGCKSSIDRQVQVEGVVPPNDDGLSHSSSQAHSPKFDCLSREVMHSPLIRGDETFTFAEIIGEGTRLPDPVVAISSNGHVNPELHEVHISMVDDSISRSSSSAHIEPFLDSNTGLFSIKPKLLRPNRFFNHSRFGSPFDLSHGRALVRSVSSSPRGIRRNPLANKGAGYSRCPSPGAASAGKPYNTLGVASLSQLGLDELEAAETLEVCNNLGLSFDASNKEVKRRLVDIVVNSGQ